MKPDDICPRPSHVPPLSTRPHSPPIYLTSVWECDSPEQADALLGGAGYRDADASRSPGTRSPEIGHVYQRDSQPNADLLAAKCRALHGAERGVVTSSGTSALSVALLALMKQGDEAVVGSRVYGKTLTLFGSEAARLGIQAKVVDTLDLKAVEGALTERTRLLVVETIANPLLQVADLRALADLAHRRGALLLVDNTFASPIVCRPLELGADLVMESLTKTMNGHSDVILGFLGGKAEHWGRVPGVISTWGFNPPPFECWLALRGLATAHLRIERACENALVIAEALAKRPEIARVDYPGLATNKDRSLAERQFARGRFGTMVTFHLRGGRSGADAFIAAAKEIPFCPSLGELSTTLSHPETTSHRGLTAEQRASLDITGGTIRLSVGTESQEHLLAALEEALKAVR